MTDTLGYKKPIPLVDKASQPFFDGARRHQLMVQKCSSCRNIMWPVKSRCSNCWSPDVVWVPISGKGTLYSFTLMHQVYHPGFAGEVPYTIAEVDLAEGLRIISNIVGNSELQIGMPLEVIFEDITDDITLPKFKPTV